VFDDVIFCDYLFMEALFSLMKMSDSNEQKDFIFLYVTLFDWCAVRVVKCEM